LYQEILDVIGAQGHITEAKLANMRYLKACQQESSRLVPVVNTITRKTQVDMVLNGFKIPTGTIVTWNIPVASSNEELFAEPEVFLPERWIRGCPQRQEVDPYAHLPFSHGQRSCIGQRIARLELYMLAFKIVQKYRLEYNGPEIKPNYSGFGRPDREVKLRMIRR